MEYIEGPTLEELLEGDEFTNGSYDEQIFLKMCNIVCSPVMSPFFDSRLLMFLVQKRP